MKHSCFGRPAIAKPWDVSGHTMNEYININEIVELVKQQEPLRKDVINALTECKSGQWRGNAYFQFVDSKNANQDGAEWQFNENIVIEHQKKGTIIIDFLKNKKIGGLEFYELIGNKKMNSVAKFEITESYNITGRGLVIVGDIIDGSIKTENYLTIKSENNELKLKIKGIDFVDKRISKVSKLGLTFYYENEEQKIKIQNLKIDRQISIITNS